MKEIDFNKLQKESLEAFLNHNPELKDKRLLVPQLELNSKLICTILSRYHKMIYSDKE